MGANDLQPRFLPHLKGPGSFVGPVTEAIQPWPCPSQRRRLDSTTILDIGGSSRGVGQASGGM